MNKVKTSSLIFNRLLTGGTLYVFAVQNIHFFIRACLCLLISDGFLKDKSFTNVILDYKLLLSIINNSFMSLAIQ